jgi:F-type H+-transporting ATPase subunit alpha
MEDMNRNNNCMLRKKEVFTYGVITSIGSGVVTIQGLLLAFVGQVLSIMNLKGGTCYGIIVNLARDKTMNLVTSALLLTPAVRMHEGSKVLGQSSLASIIIGDFAIGSLVDPVGTVILNTSRLDAKYAWVIESPAVGIVDRQSVFEPLQTGILCIDSMIPIGRGQRELVLGDRYTGKTSIGIDTILNQRNEKILCVYVAIGQKCSSILEVYLALLSRNAVSYLCIVVAGASTSSVCQFLSAYTGCAISEFFMLVREVGTYLMLDDLSRHAVAYREIYLLLRRPPGREAYPGEIFFVHSRLLERSALLAQTLGGGSTTAFPVIETLGGDVSSYITTNVISITDGQIFLSIDLFLGGIKPAVDVGLSVTRVGSAAQWDGMKLVGGSYKLELAQFAELQSFSQFAADLGTETKARLSRGLRLVELLKQFTGNPQPLGKQLGILSIAGQDLISKLDIDKVQPFVSKYTSIPLWVYMFVPPGIVGNGLIKQLK